MPAKSTKPMKITIPDTVLFTELQGEGVLLNLETGEYFGLDEVALGIWKALGECGTLDVAQSRLLGEYEVSAEVLASDLDTFLGRLSERKLVLLDDE